MRREKLLIGAYFTLMTWGWRHPRWNWREFRESHCTPLSAMRKERWKVEKWERSSCSNMALEEAFPLPLT